jgi:hypothetical protein
MRLAGRSARCNAAVGNPTGGVFSTLFLQLSTAVVVHGMRFKAVTS